ncbi:type II toxin-antitoxin system HicA family toxin [Geminocystis sp.]|uniref:type II toxin-antitoxin system HicA family toxin n=1 Tax=Geminocystis sp. TaxID=2664100 RepID=UPI0035937140
MSKLEKLIKKLLSRPPEARFEEIYTVLKAYGYQEIRSKGSHHAFENDRGDVIIVPKKGGQKVKKTYIEEIINKLNLEDSDNE